MRSSQGMLKQVAYIVFRQEAVKALGECLSQVCKALLARVEVRNMLESVNANGASA
jgi:hypothetical protein